MDPTTLEDALVVIDQLNLVIAQQRQAIENQRRINLALLARNAALTDRKALFIAQTVMNQKLRDELVAAFVEIRRLQAIIAELTGQPVAQITPPPPTGVVLPEIPPDQVREFPDDFLPMPRPYVKPASARRVDDGEQ